MEIPKTINVNNHEYIFIKQNNNKTYLYKESTYGWLETFCDYDLGLVKEIIPRPKFANHVKNRW